MHILTTRNRTRLLILAALVALAAVGLLAWYLNTPRGYVRRVFATTPLPPESREVVREVQDWSEGPACPYARMAAVYETDMPWNEVAGFYQQYLRDSAWGAAERRVLGTDTAANTPIEEIEARWPFAAGQRELTMTVVNFSQLANAPPPASRTMFTIGVEYIPDIEFFRSSALCQD
jgi:hypothetical protein